MAKLIPFAICLVFGVFIGIALSRKWSTSAAGGEWERKYRELYNRYRDLTRQLNNGDSEAVQRTNRLRQTLWDVQGMLRNPDEVTPDRARAALEEIDNALKEAQEPR